MVWDAVLSVSRNLKAVECTSHKWLFQSKKQLTYFHIDYAFLNFLHRILTPSVGRLLYISVRFPHLILKLNFKFSFSKQLCKCSFWKRMALRTLRNNLRHQNRLYSLCCPVPPDIGQSTCMHLTGMNCWVTRFRSDDVHYFQGASPLTQVRQGQQLIPCLVGRDHMHVIHER